MRLSFKKLALFNLDSKGLNNLSVKKFQNPSSIACLIASDEKRGGGGVRYRECVSVMWVGCMQDCVCNGA